jgi:hypothetical protein
MHDICINLFDGLNPLSVVLSQIRPGAHYTIRGYNYDDIEWNSPDIEKPSEEEVTAALNAEISTRQNQKTWVPHRVSAYPAIEKQLDMIYWDQMNGTTVWKDTITSVKKKFPKGN